MTEKEAVSELAAHVQAVLGDGPFLPAAGWHHMGAVICDAIIQQARHYERWVRPRVEGLQSTWPDADTVIRFRARLVDADLGAVLRTKHQRKLAAIGAVADLLAASGVDTRDDLHTWLKQDNNRSALLAIHGVGLKTVDYLGSLVGGSHVAVDVHLRTFAREAGLGVTAYLDLRHVYEETADRLGHDRGALEHAVWSHMSNRPKP
ncbi:hypothetical protein ACFWFI_06475 [Streptomyces sp. NPDC060209]|uniref:hypothetical protein n=1 Tax=Streptomyces sp. NPDC060209 TaxID=3347073 RepID=UPI00364C1E1F